MAGPDRSSRPPDSLQLLAEEAILGLPAADQLLTDAAHAAAAGVGLSCGITYVARYGVVTVASSDERANAVDEIQYGSGAGPCLEALYTRAVVSVEDLATETRWGGYRDLALQAGVRSSMSFPLIVDDSAIGALNVYSTELGPLPADQEAAAIVASSQVTDVLRTVRQLAAKFLSDPDAARDFQNRHDVDVATGMLMGEYGCSDSQARAMLAERATAQGIPLQHLVTRMISSGGFESGSTP